MGLAVRAVDKAYQTVRDGIVDGRFAGSARITEHEIAQAAGVSRTPVREALRRLHAEGLVEFAPNQGAVVAAWTDADTDEVFDLRALLESYGTQRAALRATPGQIAELRILAERQVGLSQHHGAADFAEIGDVNCQFHRKLYEASGSSRLGKALSSLIEAPLIMKTMREYTADDLARSAAQHLEIVQAIEARDGQWAASVMRSHILAARGTLRRASADSGNNSRDRL
jgi:DNA-binding GntR family transcriptional regulator